MKREIILIAHDLRSCHNVGSLLRTAEGLGVNKVFLTGYTPYPILKDDKRLPHISNKINRQIHKTALDSEEMIDIEQSDDIEPVIRQLKNEGFTVAALEQSSSSKLLPTFVAPGKIAILLGREVEGVQAEVLEMCDLHLEIPMHGKKESFNVTQAAAMALYHCRFVNTS